MTRASPANEPTTVTVRRISPAGLVVALSDGSEGVVSARELGWDAESRQGWRERYRPGQTLRVVRSGKTLDRRPEFSVRLAQSDLWSSAEEHYPKGVLIDGVVTGIMPYGVFVELEAGLSGLVHVSRLPAWEKRPPSELFWPGDLVKVIVESVDPILRRIELGMRSLPGYRWQREQPASGSGAVPSPVAHDAIPPRPSVETLLAQAPKMVLVVEDDPSQRKAVEDWLRLAGQRAIAVASAEEALELVPTFHPELLLMDVGLEGMNGIQATRQILSVWPDVQCVLMTDWGRAEQHAAELDDLCRKGVALLLKPLLPQDLLEVLLEIPGRSSPFSDQTPSARNRLEKYDLKLGQVQQSVLIDLMARLQNAVHADKVVLFEFDPDSRQVAIVEQHGRPSLRTEVLPELVYSPVRDAAEAGQTVFATTPDEVAGRSFQHLAPLLDFKACAGLPIPVDLRNRYALFIFYAEPETFTPTMLTRIEAAATSAGVWLERRQFAKQTAGLHRVALLGQLGRALVHEVSGRLTPINLAAEELRTRCDAVEKNVKSNPDQAIAEAQNARQALQSLGQQAEALAKTTRSFSRMTRSGQEEILRLDHIVGEAVEVLRDSAATFRVKVERLPVPRLLFTRAQATPMQQAIVNVLLNAIQQIEQARPGQGGRVEIGLSQAEHTGQHVLRVTLEDDGPGIHRRLWERIFEMDYTTRPEGSGLGLYISRSLLEAQGGRIYVAESHVLWGTAFVVELPYKP